MNYKRFNLKVPEDLYTRFMDLANQEHKTVEELLLLYTKFGMMLAEMEFDGEYKVEIIDRNGFRQTFKEFYKGIHGESDDN